MHSTLFLLFYVYCHHHHFQPSNKQKHAFAHQLCSTIHRLSSIRDLKENSTVVFLVAFHQTKIREQNKRECRKMSNDEIEEGKTARTKLLKCKYSTSNIQTDLLTSSCSPSWTSSWSCSCAECLLHRHHRCHSELKMCRPVNTNELEIAV